MLTSPHRNIIQNLQELKALLIVTNCDFKDNFFCKIWVIKMFDRCCCLAVFEMCCIINLKYFA